MEKHGIASAREFLRRVVLFFFWRARYLIYRREVELDEDDASGGRDGLGGNYVQPSIKKRDFAISTYNY